MRIERKVFKVRPWSVDATNDGGQAMGHWPLHPLDGRCLDAADSVAEPTSGCKRPPGQSSNVYGTRGSTDSGAAQPDNHPAGPANAFTDSVTGFVPSFRGPFFT